MRHFDCAQFYQVRTTRPGDRERTESLADPPQNEQEVGAALKQLSKEPGYRREDMWLTSKAWNS